MFLTLESQHDGEKEGKMEKRKREEERKGGMERERGAGEIYFRAEFLGRNY